MSGRKLGRAPVPPLRWLPAVFALLVTTVGLAMASCSSGGGLAPTTSGPNNDNNNDNGCIGATCPASCAVHEVPGCACSVEGQHLLCGKVDATYPTEGTSPGATVCGSGVSVCTDGVWGDCQISGAVTIIPNAPPGFYAENLGVGTTCATNPCDPQCIDFKDTPTGVDAGAAISSSDAGLTLAGDGGGICVPRSCADLGFNCGMQSDTCGNVISCGVCVFPQTCGGGGTPSVCGLGGNCTGLCLNQVQCPSSGTTSISGVTYMPNGTTPLPNVLVYVPNGPVTAFSAQVSCVTGGNCNAEVSGNPLVATVSAVDGTFTLNNVPVGVSFPVVMQLGRFRRQFTMPAVTMCTSTPVPCTSAQACLSRFPQTQFETSAADNIPKMAFSTGEVDALECVWAKIGIASTGAPGSGGTNYGTGEFTPGPTSGRINLYAGSGANGTYITDVGFTTPYDTTLLGNPTALSAYDMLLFPCQGGEFSFTNQKTYQTNIANFANAGGRVFETHFSYIWFITQGTTYSSPLSSAINWTPNGSYAGWQDPTIGHINTTFAGGATLASWLMVPGVNASPAYGDMQVNTLRHDFSGVNAPSEIYVSINVCEDTQSDYYNCGSCGTQCGGGKVCSNGACASSCGTGLTSCGGGVCSNLTNDTNNCGTCGTKCGVGSTCVSGTCTCQSGTSVCSGKCISLSTDPNNCGSCGKVCGAGVPCVGGVCTCATAGLTACYDGIAGGCVNLQSDPANCGACGTVCWPGETCSAGACSACGAGATLCTHGSITACYQTQTDPDNCGACGTTCTKGGACVAGVCQCPPGYTNCSGTCVELSTNASHCGSCTTACSGSTAYCKAGTCSNGCGALTTCTKACVNEQTDPQFCGSCTNKCAAGEACVGGACNGCVEAGAVICSGDCVLLSNDNNNCGACGTKCGYDQTCVGGVCACPSGFSACTDAGHNVCVNKQTDPYNCGGCNVVCAAGQTCTAGACVAVATTCSATASDPYNCGGCGVVCGNGQTCVSGTCTCGSGATTCTFPLQASFNTPLTATANNQCGRVVVSDFHVESANDTQVPFPSECPAGPLTPQEFMLAQALFDLAGCVNIANQTACVPVTCGYLGLNCGTAGDGCGNTLNCGTCTGLSTCGGGGISGVCGVPKTYSPASFTRDYDATHVCTGGQVPVWRLYSWSALTPGNSSISFSIATATTLAGLATATTYPLGWSSPPGVPTGLMAGHPATAQAGTPNTDLDSASPDSTLLANMLPQNNFYLRVIATLNPTSTLLQAPTLSSWDMQIDCIDNN